MQSPNRATRSVAALTALAIASTLTACTAATAPSAVPSGPSASPHPAGSPRPAGSPPPAASSAGPGDAGAVSPNAFLVVRRGTADEFELIEAASSDWSMALPIGTPRTNWDRIVTATPAGGQTIVRDTIVQPGFGGPELKLDGHWELPKVGLDSVPVGRSLDGSTIALVEGPYDAAAGRSRFAIVEHRLAGELATAADATLELARIIELPGAFEYDTLSPDGRILYVVQHLDDEAGGAYQVRAVDVPTGRMRDTVIVDKGNPDERMAGSAIAQIRRADGLVLTLYRGPEHPFIHALSSVDAWALCIDLPDARSTDADAALDWGLAQTPNGAAVYAVNASLGLVADVDPSQLAVRRTATLDATAAAPFELAKFGHGEVGPVGRRVVVAPDASTIYAAGGDGIVVVSTRNLATTRHDLAGSRVDAIALTPDGALMFALIRGEGQILALEPATGRVLGRVAGGGFTDLVAVGPY